MTIQKTKPRHRVLAEILRKNILSGKWPPNSMIPPEMELCKEFEASRTTIRKALETLTLEGFIVRKPRKGTWVREPARGHQSWILESASINYVYDPEMTAEILRVESVVRESARPILEGFEDGESLTRFRLLRRIKDTPLALVDTYLSSVYADDIVQAFDPVENNYIFEILEQVSGRPVIEVSDTYDVILAVGEIAEVLNVSVGSPLFFVTRLLSDQRGQLMQATGLHLRPDMYKPTIVHRRSASTP